MSDEFVEVILGKLIEALRPSPFDQLEEPTLNAALAIIASMQPQSVPMRRAVIVDEGDHGLNRQSSSACRRQLRVADRVLNILATE